MLNKTTHLELPRRVTAYYLVFALAAIVWLAGGIVFVSKAILSSQAESACLANLGKATGLVATEFRNGGPEAVQAFLSRWTTQHALAWCALADPKGTFVAHSKPERIGQPAQDPTGAAVQWGEASRVRFVDDQSRVVREYRTPVYSGGKTLGTLYLAVVEPGLWSVVRTLAEYAPAAVLGPLLLMSLGVMALRRTVRPLSQIEAQLERLSAAEVPDDVELTPVLPASSAALGWNRLAEERAAAHARSGLESRLTEALEGFRQRKADLILNSLPDGVALTDNEGRVTFANQALAALLGLREGSAPSGRTMEQLLGTAATGPGSPFTDPESRDRTVVMELDRSGDMAQGVLRIARHPLRLAKGSPSAGHVWSIRDITQQKLAEQMRNQFVNSATHELRTPLANIKAYAETLVLSEMLDVEKQKEFCNTINAEATRLARFIDDLLSISSMEVGSLSLARQETDVERLLREVLEKVRPQMLQKRIALRASLPEKLPKLRLDKDKITATLVNLLGNAAKYTPEGGQVHFKVLAKDDVLQIEVEDTGFGISPSELPRIFDKFFRSSDPRVQEQTGSGLGLSLAQEVVRLHGGKIQVHSELNKGTRFTVTLPLG
jgi:two-component system phosphate regulon sensor histidine kinase PhoR